MNTSLSVKIIIVTLAVLLLIVRLPDFTSTNNNELDETTTKVPRSSFAKKNEIPRALPRRENSSGLVFSNYLVHIPKTAGKFAWQAVRELTESSPQYKQLKSQPYTICELNFRNATARFPHGFPKTDRKGDGKECTFWSSEQPLAENALYNYLIVREPRTHVLSQYFHCTEAPIHANKHLMPDLTTWLERWVEAMDNPALETTNQEYHCYRPINLQSEFATFDPDRHSIEDLREKAVVVGTKGTFHPTLCAITIEWNGFVPPACNCSSSSPPKRRRTEQSYFSHGVKHHGDSYSTSSYQDQLIHKLTEKDRVLYSYAERLIEHKILELERRYDVVICKHVSLLERMLGN